LKDSDNIFQCGLKFFIKNQEDLGINSDTIEEILTAIASIGVQ